ncbi:serum paraoxonase/arylesteras-like protein [Lindgomyces ingoldianus]|uniref:Serum paraoxonase/arylesteras-like protein n=1 Tax=Lindgomyces ingoldianus TaxID=673940 RepID=A0ACB6Q6V9_9PLEO|nr:serum paraoxonase/arylesteras-like protein [Lindgomyces ingoldianus]KAF2462512.1 serum paraoxonase/arylesteras-like protein [Lindgomyces ingoldianus]
MPTLRTYSAIGAVFLSMLYQWWLKDVLFVTLGFGRRIEPIENFPYKCLPLQHKQLGACGDVWFDEKDRVLYAACAGMDSRNEWNPSLSRFNTSGRRPGGSNLMAIYVDEPRKDGLFRMHKIEPTRYGNAPGDGHLDLASFDVEVVDDYTLRFWLLNQRPPYDAKGNLLDARQFGANTTIEVYEYRKREKKMRHVGTGWNPSLHSPNKIAFTGANNFVVSNDRSRRVGLRKKLDPLLGGGSLTYHDDWWDTYVTTPKKIPIPGGLVRGNDDRIYVPSVIDGKIRVFELQEGGQYKQVHVIKMGMPIEHLTVDSKGDFWAVGRSKYDPTGRSSSSSIFKIEKFEERWPIRYVTTKILEDRDRKAINGASVVRYDARQKRLYLGGVYNPYIVMCEQKS